MCIDKFKSFRRKGERLITDLYDYPDIYEERFTDGANNAYKAHYQKIFAGKNIETIIDCSFGTGCLTFRLSELGYHVSERKHRV